MKAVVCRGDQVSMHFRLSLENGFVVEDTHLSEPFKLRVGDGSLLEGLEQEILGLAVGEKRHILLEPAVAFGFRDEQRILPMERKEFSDQLELEAGKIIGFTTPSGEEVAGRVMEVNDDNVLIDFNHPLADNVVEFDVEILSINN